MFNRNGGGSLLLNFDCIVGRPRGANDGLGGGDLPMLFCALTAHSFSSSFSPSPGKKSEHEVTGGSDKDNGTTNLQGISRVASLRISRSPSSPVRVLQNTAMGGVIQNVTSCLRVGGTGL